MSASKTEALPLGDTPVGPIEKIPSVPVNAVRLLSLIAVVWVAGCADRRPRPEEAFNAFLADLQYGRAETAWAALSESSRKRLLEQHERLVEASGKPADDTPSQILFGDLGIVVMSPPESVLVGSPLGNEAKLRVSVPGGKSADIRMVREGTVWKVDLMGSLDEAPDLATSLGRTTSTSTSSP
jgi:hypothetical protein